MSATDTAQLKENIRQSFRKACFMRLEGNEASAVKILQEELPAQISAWQDSADVDGKEVEMLLAEELVRTENAYWIVSRVEEKIGKSSSNTLTLQQAEAMQAVLTAQLQLGLNNIKERVQATLGDMITYQGAEALGGRIAQELSERVSSAVGEALKGYEQKINDIVGKADVLDGSLNSGLGAVADYMASLQKLASALPVKNDIAIEVDRVSVTLAAELNNFEKRDNQRWADRQGSWAKALEGIVKKSELDAALWQVQNAIGERIETKITSLQGAGEAQTKANQQLIADVKAVLAERLAKLVTAETFEGRLMSSVAMLHEAQAKALQEAVSAVQTTLEKRLSETSAPIYQRVSSLLTFADWERITREANTQLSNQLNRQIDETMAQMGEALGRRQGEMEAMVADRTEAAILRIQDLRAYLESGNANAQTNIAEGLKTVSERLAALVIETTEQQKNSLKVMQKELTGQQTQSLGMISVQQQNFLGGLQRDWDLLNKNLSELKERQAMLENDMRAIAVVVDTFRQEQVKSRESIAAAMTMVAEQLKQLDENSRSAKATIPQALQNFERQLDSRLREQAQYTSAELNALQRKLEAGIADNFGKKLKTLRVVTE